MIFLTTGDEREQMAAQMTGYLLLFAVTLPIARPFFKGLLPPSYLFNERPMGIYVALLPFGLCLPTIITIFDSTMFFSWSGQLSRFILFFWIFIIYWFVVNLGRHMELVQQERQSALTAERQLRSLRDYMTIQDERILEVRRLHHDIRHVNRLVASLLKDGQTEEALRVIDAQDQELLAATAPTYCQSAIVNAALTVYIARAKKHGIPVTNDILIQKTTFQSETSENDLAILISNVLENAIIASEKQPPGAREINISIKCVPAQNVSLQYVMEVSNLFEPLITFSNEGLPQTSKKGHGLGMMSLLAFKKKYGAEVIFEQEGGRVRLMIYWTYDNAKQNI